MAEQGSEHRMDERLAALLELERALEARVSNREAAAQLKLARAQAALLAAQSAPPPGLEEFAAREAQVDETAHAAALAALEAEAQKAQNDAAAVTDAEIDRLARQVLARVLGGAP